MDSQHLFSHSGEIFNLNFLLRSASNMITSSSITLPALLKVDPAPLFVELELPAHGWVGSPMAAWFKIHNRTSQLLEVELNLQASDAFMFAGQKQVIDLMTFLRNEAYMIISLAQVEINA